MPQLTFGLPNVKPLLRHCSNTFCQMHTPEPTFLATIYSKTEFTFALSIIVWCSSVFLYVDFWSLISFPKSHFRRTLSWNSPKQWFFNCFPGISNEIRARIFNVCNSVRKSYCFNAFAIIRFSCFICFWTSLCISNWDIYILMLH